MIIRYCSTFDSSQIQPVLFLCTLSLIIVFLFNWNSLFLTIIMSTNCLARDFVLHRIIGDQPEDVEEQVTDVTANFRSLYLIYYYIVLLPCTLFAFLMLWLYSPHEVVGVNSRILPSLDRLCACLPAYLPLYLYENCASTYITVRALLHFCRSAWCATSISPIPTLSY